MVNIIAYALPAIVASYVLIKLESKENFLSFITGTGLFMILIYLLNSSVLMWVFDYSNGVIDFSSVSIKFMVLYVLLSMIWTAILPPLIWNIHRNIQFKVKEKIILKDK